MLVSKVKMLLQNLWNFKVDDMERNFMFEHNIWQGMPIYAVTLQVYFSF